MTRELDEMYIKTQNFVHQIGVEDGTVLAVAQRIIERLLKVEVLLALKLLIICGVWETLLYESQDSVGSILFVQSSHLGADLLHHFVAELLVYHAGSHGRNIYHRIFIEHRHDACRHFALQGDARRLVAEWLGAASYHGLAGESQLHVLTQFCILRQVAGAESAAVVDVRIDIVLLAVDVDV